MNLQDTMMLYGVTLGARRTKRERYLFASQLRESLKAHNWSYELQMPPKKRRILRIENILVGDLQRAKTIFVIPFDTPAKSVLPCKYYPFHPELTAKEERRDFLVQTLAAVALIAMALVLIWLAIDRRGKWALMLLPAAVLSYFAFQFIKGRSNPYNFNRASASVAVASRLLEELKGKKKDVAFAFCDQSTNSYEGYKLLAKDLPVNANLILLDSISKSDELVLAHGVLANLRAKKLMELLPEGTRERTYQDEEVGRNLLSIFPGAMILTGGSVEDGELVVRNTRTKHDIGLDLPRLEKITQSLIDFVSR